MPEQRHIHSEEIEEMIGVIPNRFLRWGLTIILTVFVGIIAACYFIKYPEVVPVPIELTSYNPPVSLKAALSKRIDKLFFSDGDSVKNNEVIMLLESATDYEDLLTLEKLIINTDKHWEEIIVSDTLFKNYSLGELQNSFVQLRKQSVEFSNFLSMSLLPKKRALLEDRIAKHNTILAREKEQYEILKKELVLQRKGYARDSVLYSINGITQVDLERSKQALLKKESESIGFAATISTTENTILSLREQLIENTIQENTQREQFYAQLNESRQQLNAEFERWKKNYLVIAPVAGKLSLPKIWNANQNVSADEVVAAVIPFEREKLIGKGIVAYSGYAKIKAGQKVNVKLDNYPYMRYGMVSGIVTNISPVPQENGYAVDIAFTHGLRSNYGTELNYAYQMTGTADIITDDLRLIEQFLFPIKDLIYRIEK